MIYVFIYLCTELKSVKMFASFCHGSYRTVLLCMTPDSTVHMNSLVVRNSTRHLYRRAGATHLPTQKSGGKSKQFSTFAGWRTNSTRHFYTHVQSSAQVKVQGERVYCTRSLVPNCTQNIISDRNFACCVWV